MFAGHVNVRYEIGIQVIRADGTIDNFGTVTSTAWGRFSLRKLRPWFLIKRANWRNRQRIKAG
jgi:hypothetical protein